MRQHPLTPELCDCFFNTNRSTVFKWCKDQQHLNDTQTNSIQMIHRPTAFEWYTNQHHLNDTQTNIIQMIYRSTSFKWYTDQQHSDNTDQEHSNNTQTNSIQKIERPTALKKRQTNIIQMIHRPTDTLVQTTSNSSFSSKLTAESTGSSTKPSSSRDAEYHMVQSTVSAGSIPVNELPIWPSQ